MIFCFFTLENLKNMEANKLKRREIVSSHSGNDNMATGNYTNRPLNENNEPSSDSFGGNLFDNRRSRIRKINLKKRALHAFRKRHDVRNNCVRTSKYTWWSFVPHNLFE